MTIVKTHDGMYGVSSEQGVRWFNSEFQLKSYCLASMEIDLDSQLEVDSFNKEFESAIESMVKNNHIFAQFETDGTFIHSYNSEE